MRQKATYKPALFAMMILSTVAVSAQENKAAPDGKTLLDFAKMDREIDFATKQKLLDETRAKKAVATASAPGANPPANSAPGGSPQDVVVKVSRTAPNNSIEGVHLRGIYGVNGANHAIFLLSNGAIVHRLAGETLNGWTVARLTVGSTISATMQKNKSKPVTIELDPPTVAVTAVENGLSGSQPASGTNVVSAAALPNPRLPTAAPMLPNMPAPSTGPAPAPPPLAFNPPTPEQLSRNSPSSGVPSAMPPSMAPPMPGAPSLPR
jgi:hypothetical protein